MGTSQLVVTICVALLGGVGSQLVIAFARRPKTRAEAGNLNAAAKVTASADNREWAQMFIDRTTAAEVRAGHAEERADDADAKVAQLESRLILVYGYVRSLRDEMRKHDLTPPAPPAELEVFWNGNH